jgi:GT2 family glycosyltransferase
MDLSVIVVNYRSASYTLHAVASALGQEVATERGERAATEIVVIDNGSSHEDVALLDGLPRQVTLIRNDVNRGFAAAANQGIAETRGRFVCLLNPDTHLFPGAFQRLLDELYRAHDVAAAGPRTWWDDERTFLLPLVRLPTPASIVAEGLAQLGYRPARVLTRAWHRRDLALWRAGGPAAIDMLCGACLMVRREALERVGAFDPAYVLYYEDADWCRRARRAGYRLLHVPAAEIVHYYNQSAQAAPQQSLAWMVRSRRRYLEAHAGPRLAAACERVIEATSRLAERRQPRPPVSIYVDLGSQEEPPSFCGARPGLEREALFEMSHHWSFAFKAAAFTRAAELRVSLPIWKRLQPGRYYTRLTDLATSRTERIWAWRKS